MIVVIRIAGQCKQKKGHLETLKRLKLHKKYSCRLVDPKDKVRMGMVKAVSDEVVYGEISDDLIKELKKNRGKEGSEIYGLHPARGGLKKSSKLPYPKGILGYNPDVSKLVERML